jgi:hypothetical protein
LVSLLAIAALLAGLAQATTGRSTTPRSTCAHRSRAVIAGHRACLRPGQRCRRRYEKIYEKHGFTCIAHRLRKRRRPRVPTPTEPPPAPQPPPPAPPLQGHYSGSTSQGYGFSLDVDAEARTVPSLGVDRIDETCDPQGTNSVPPVEFVFSQSQFTLRIDPFGGFEVQGGTLTYVNGNQQRNPFRIVGEFDDGTVQGTITWTTTFDQGGVTYTCTPSGSSAGKLSFAASHTG